jgi:hypothetical protein
MAAYVMLPPMIVVISYCSTTCFCFSAAQQARRLSWGVLLASTLAVAITQHVLGGWLAPILLGWT